MKESDRFQIGDKVVYNDREANKFSFDTTHDKLYQGKVLKGEVVAKGVEGICVDFGEDFQGHSGRVGEYEEGDERAYPNGTPNEEYIMSEKSTLWFFDYDADEVEFLTSDLSVLPLI